MNLGYAYWARRPLDRVDQLLVRPLLRGLAPASFVDRVRRWRGPRLRPALRWAGPKLGAYLRAARSIDARSTEPNPVIRRMPSVGYLLDVRDAFARVEEYGGAAPRRP